jgi:general secretion pathway protein D
VTEVSNLKYRIAGSVVLVVPIDDPDQEILHRTYNVLSDISARINAMAPVGAAAAPAAGNLFGGDGAGVLQPLGGAGPGADWKAVFGGFGVGWPRGSSITYLPAVGKIFVANTPDNLVKFERILRIFNVAPSQIEIEARFVEVFQTDLDSLGLEWMLTDDWEVKQKQSDAGLPLSQRQRIVMGENGSTGGFTKGNRFLSDLQQSAVLQLTGADEIMSIASVLTNPELNVVLHALQQSGNTDLLSAPKITTKSGQQATIKVVTEYIYPTDFEVTPITSTGGGGAGAASVVGGLVQPGGFETREVGVLLEVLPEVSEEGQLINLTLTPQVVGDPEWRDYGTTFEDSNGNIQRMPMEQPFFHVRTITTSLSIYNGATVVMGGMITEHRNDVDDRIPFLGDIPVIGRLFRSKYNHSQKRNLLIFVTARLVDPAGRPLARIEDTITQLMEVVPDKGAVATP